MPRIFNTGGPCVPTSHYMIPAASRLPDVPQLVASGHYFVVHAPRQTGKTTTLKALAAELTDSGRYAALLTSCEPGRWAGTDVGEATRAILDQMREEADDQLPVDLTPPPRPEVADHVLFGSALRAWSRICPRPVVLFLDEIDALEGTTLNSVLSQLRSRAAGRPGAFPASVALCGLRDLRDYKTAAGGDARQLGGPSPFNIIVESLRLGDFTLDEVRALYGQHTAETGQTFTPEAVERAFALTAGQPWLVNALASEIVTRMAVPVSTQVTVDHVDTARERLVRGQAVHFDALVHRLHDPRVRAIVQPMITGEEPTAPHNRDDLRHSRDLGLLAPDEPARPANPIYQEVIVRALTDGVLGLGPGLPQPRSFVRPDGRMDFARLLAEFAEWWKAYGNKLASRQNYHEAAPHLLFHAYLQRVVNGGGQVHTEYGVGRGRVDLFIIWPYLRQDGSRALQHEAIELKVRGAKDGDPLEDALAQLDAYLDQLGLKTGTIIIFDRRPTAPPIAERTVITTMTSRAGHAVTLLRA